MHPPLDAAPPRPRPPLMCIHCGPLQPELRAPPHWSTHPAPPAVAASPQASQARLPAERDICGQRPEQPQSAAQQPPVEQGRHQPDPHNGAGLKPPRTIRPGPIAPARQPPARPGHIHRANQAGKQRCRLVARRPHRHRPARIAQTAPLRSSWRRGPADDARHSVRPIHLRQRPANPVHAPATQVVRAHAAGHRHRRWPDAGSARLHANYGKPYPIRAPCRSGRHGHRAADAGRQCAITTGACVDRGCRPATRPLRAIAAQSPTSR